MQVIAPDRFYALIENGQVSPVVLLTGEETYLIERALHKLVDRALPEGHRDFNMDVMYGADSTAADVALQADTLPMMADRRVVVLKEADKLKDPAGLKPYAASPSPSTLLVIVAGGADKRKADTLARAIGGDGMRAHFYHPFERDVPKWINILTAEAGYRMDKDASAYLREVLGDNLALIEAELNKVYNFKGEKKNISYADVLESVGDFGIPLVYDFVDAVADKDADRAIVALAKVLRDKSQPPVMVLGAMAGHWRKLLTAKKRLEKGEEREKVAASMRIFFKQKGSFFNQVSRQSEEELTGAFHLFHEADKALKSSSVPPRLVLENLVFGLSGGKRSAKSA